MESSGPLSDRYADYPVHQHLPVRSLLGNAALLRYYHSVFADTNMDGDQSNNIDREDYKLVSTLFAFDLTPDQGDSGHFNLIRTGNVDVEINCTRASTTNQNVILYAQFDNVLEIDKNRKLAFDFTL